MTLIRFVRVGERRAMPPRCQNAFTLLELLSVVLLIGILLALGLPALSSFRATAVSSGSRAVYNTLNLARQYAINRHTNTRVVFYYDGTTQDLNLSKQYGTYTVIARTNMITDPECWCQVGNWESLPLGALFGNSSVTNGSLNDASSLNSTDMDFGFGTRTVAYIEFKPTGAATSPTGGGSNAGTLSIYEGTRRSDGTPAYVLNSNRVDIVYKALVGRIQILRP